MKVMIGARGFEFFFLLDDRRRRRDDDLLDLVNAAAFFAALFLENESVVLRDLRRDIRLDRLIDVRENVERHQLGDELVRFQTELRRELLHDDRRLDVNDVLRPALPLRGAAAACAPSVAAVAAGAGAGSGAFGFGGRRSAGGCERCANPRNWRKNGRFLFQLRRPPLSSAAVSCRSARRFRRPVDGVLPVSEAAALRARRDEDAAFAAG